ncbi:MAG: hypothetical protein AAF703_23245 [Cyanobacteria bacterium P01_D01_bin.105]
MSKTGAQGIDPTSGEDAQHQALATSDLSVEELLAGGADVDELVSAGVLEDDDQNTDFTEANPEALKYKGGPVMSDDEFNALMKEDRWYISGRYLTEDAPDKKV